MRRIWFDLTTCGWRHALSMVRERVLIKAAFLLPRPLVYWAFVRFVNAATNCSSPDISCIDAMKRNDAWYSR